MTFENALMDRMVTAALAAGEQIMQVYAKPIDSETKSDGSPVTIADQLAEDIILAALAETGLPVLAEESAAAGNIPHLGNRFFVVDPLDGTKEFIKRNGQFTVNIALVEDVTPIMGVVYAPAIDTIYVGVGDRAFRATTRKGNVGQWTPIAVKTDGPLNVVASRSHGHAALEPLCAALDVADNVSVGSSLKFCLVADGTARFYPRFTPTCEWDTAAGQAVLTAAGGAVYAIDGAPLTYGKAEGRFYNPYFAAAASAEMASDIVKRMRDLIGDEGFVSSFSPR